jgi:hypothetical protein
MGDGRAALVGVWRLLACDTEYQDSGTREPYFGPARPAGYIAFTPEGRMLALLVGGDRVAGESQETQAALFHTMVAYAGRYRLEGDQFTTIVDVSWNEAWTGTEQIRYYFLDGDRLDVVTAWLPHPADPQHRTMRARLSFERAQ